MKKIFLDMLIRRWDNLEQAQGYPTEYAYCHYDWDQVGDIITSRQWYDHNNEVYRERDHDLEETDHNLILHIHYQNAKIIFAKRFGGFYGESEFNATNNNGIRIESKITLEEDKFTTFDRGIAQDESIVWGKPNGAFIFKPTR